jgi:hypothetical protein
VEEASLVVLEKMAKLLQNHIPDSPRHEEDEMDANHYNRNGTTKRLSCNNTAGCGSRIYYIIILFNIAKVPHDPIEK